MAQAYTAPNWSTGEGISPSNLQSISNVLEGIVQGTDKAIHKFDIYGSYIEITYVDGTVGGFETVGLKGIRRIDKTSSGGIDTYTIIYTDGTTYSFEVVNGASLEVVDRLDSTDKKSALSANQGRVLNESKADKSEVEGLIEDLNQTNATLKAMSTMTSEDDLDYSIDGNIESARFEGYARKSRNLVDLKTTVENYKLPTPLPSGTYTISFDSVSGTQGWRLSNAINTSSNSVATNSKRTENGRDYLTLTTTFEINYMNFSSNSGTPTNIMLNNGSSPLPYEPYEPRIIKPSGVVESINRNLIGYGIKKTGYASGNSFVYFNQAISYVFDTKKLPNNIYFNSEKGNRSNVSYWATDDLDSSSKALYVENTTHTEVFEVKKEYPFVMLQFSYGVEDIGNAYVYENKSDIYTPYEADSITLPYIPLGVNDIKDELIVNADGTGKFIKRVEQVDLGSLNWSNSANYFSCTDYGAKAKTVDASATPNLICETLEAYRSSTIASIGKGTNYMAVYHTNGNLIATPNESPKGLMIYELATPTETPLTAEEVAQILALKTFAEVTYIDADGLAYDIGYLFNSAKAIKDLKDIINALTSTQTLEVADNANAPMSIKSVKKIDLEEKPIEEITEEQTEEPTE